MSSSGKEEDNTEALPGFEAFVPQIVADRAGAVDMTDEKKYTAEVVMRDYPETYRSVVRALFFYRLPNRAIRDLFRMSGSTVAAIRDHVIAQSDKDPRAALLLEKRKSSQRDIVICRLIDALEDKLESGRADTMGITEILDAIQKLERAKPATNGVDTVQPKSGEVIDVDEYDLIMNGLMSGKKSAAHSDGEQPNDNAPECSRNDA